MIESVVYYEIFENLTEFGLFSGFHTLPAENAGTTDLCASISRCILIILFSICVENP